MDGIPDPVEVLDSFYEINRAYNQTLLGQNHEGVRISTQSVRTHWLLQTLYTRQLINWGALQRRVAPKYLERDINSISSTTAGILESAFEDNENAYISKDQPEDIYGVQWYTLIARNEHYNEWIDELTAAVQSNATGYLI
jgi:hypothetical protein